MKKGVITFGDDLSFPIQILGSHAEADNTWLWAWANPQSNFPDHILKAALHVRSTGEQQGIRELTEDKFVMDEVTDHMLAMLCGGLCNGECCYRMPYQGGAAFVLLENTPEPIRAIVGPERVPTVLSQVISTFEVDHRSMASNFLRQQGFVVNDSPAALSASRPSDKAESQISFDERGRISNIDMTINPSAGKKPWWKRW